MEIHFVIKTKVDVLLKVQDILSIFENGIQRNIGGVFNDLTIDVNSLTIENEQIDRKHTKQTTKRQPSDEIA